MSQEHEKTSSDTHVSEGIHPEPAPFEPGYQPGTLPQISVPDLAEDAQGLTAEALANVPTLTELVEPDVAESEVVEEAAELLTEHSDSDSDLAPQASEPSEEAPSLVEAEALAQDEPAQADTWGEQLQVRMGKLTDDIHTLHVRLDRLEERNKKKV
jgi:hypothetical protein